MTILMRALFTAAGAFLAVMLVSLTLWVWTGDLRHGGIALIALIAAVLACLGGAGVASTLEQRQDRS